MEESYQKTSSQSSLVQSEALPPDGLMIDMIQLPPLDVLQWTYDDSIYGKGLGLGPPGHVIF